MSSNVGLSTPRGSGTSGYVQRNSAFLKPRNAGYGAPYPPITSPGAPGGDYGSGSGFKQRKPDQQILEHDRKRAIELQVLEERERLEETNEELEKDNKKPALTEEEIEERCDALRAKLLKELEDGGKDGDRGGRRQQQQRDGKYDRDRRQLKSYQVHELAEAKIQESERLRKALGIKEDWEKKDVAASSTKEMDKEKADRREEENPGGRHRERDERRDRRRRYS